VANVPSVNRNAIGIRRDRNQIVTFAKKLADEADPEVLQIPTAVRD
jgi:hypothetical protein